MPKINYTGKTIKGERLGLVEQANAIIDEYRAQGFVLTLRQLYYQFVARDLIENTQRAYKRLGSLISDGRLAGLIDWHAIEDRTRNLVSLAHWSSPAEIVGSCATQYRVDKWADQDCRVEVWIEKEALVGVIARVCNDLDVPYFACRGYVSQSEQWRAGQRLASYYEAGQKIVVVHLGDHDPSGIDMTRDNRDRLSLFDANEVEVERIALNMDQVEEYGPPPNPAKVTDSRFDGYVIKFGGDSWELDALEPRVIESLIREAVERRLDDDRWQAQIEKETEARAAIAAVAATL